MTDLTFAHLVDIEEKLQLLEFCVDNIGEAVYWLTMDFRFRNVNAAACRMLGYSRDELLSLSLHDIDPDYSHESMQSDLELLKRAGTLSLRGSHTARDGRIIPVEITPSYFIYSDVEYICCIVRDITERIKAEEALRMSQFIIDKASFGILRGQADAKILYANEYGARMLGYTQDELCSMTFFDIDPSLTRAFWQEHRKKVTATGSNTFESVHRRKDGTIYPVEVIVNYQEFQGQEFSCSFFRDITERKRAEEALLFSHFCINKAGIGIYHCDEHGTIFSVNDYACASLGYSKDELCALSVFEIDPVITPERMLEIKKILDTSGAATHETIHRRRDGTTFPVEITINVLEFLGRTFSISFVKDITERKRVEEELLLTQFCVDKASIALYQLTEEGEIWNVNECACQSLGYSIEELRSMTVFDIDPAATREVFNDLAIRTFSCGSVTFERMHRRKDGITFPVEITANSLEFRGRRFAICFVKDITDRKRVEESLRKAHDDLESRVRERTGQLSSLTAELSLAEERERRRIATELHDQVGQTLILSKIKLDSLLSSLPSESSGKLIGEIRKYLDQSIQDIRSLTFQLSPPLLYEVGFEAAVEWLGEEFEEKYGFRVEFQDDGKKKPLAEETGVALFQMVRELLLNVAKHARAKRVTISIGKVSGKIKIIVADDGSGFDGLNGMRRKNKKSGFGLFNISHRIEYMGGEFKIKSRIDQGTSVTLTLPVKADENTVNGKKP